MVIDASENHFGTANYTPKKKIIKFFSKIIFYIKKNTNLAYRNRTVRYL